MHDIERWRAYVSTPKFKRDVAEAVRLLEADDMEGLAEFASRNSGERARIAAARVRENTVPLPPVDEL